MKMQIEIAGGNYLVNMDSGYSIAIPLLFNQQQPNHFGAQKASAEPLQADGFVGDTKQGGSCNVAQISFVPHCNGTHTESCGHITNELIAVGDVAPQTLLSAVLITVSPQLANENQEDYLPTAQANDLQITREMLLPIAQYHSSILQAVVIRTSPNGSDKESRCYNEKNFPPYLTMDAIGFLNELGVQHLLVDVPSIDRMHDDGLLTNHHIFWQVPQGTHQLTDTTQVTKTITEMIYVADYIEDGKYLLNLQIPHFHSDAAPSHPILYPLIEI